MSTRDDWVEVNEFPAYEIHPDAGIRRKGGLKSLKGRNWLGYPKVTLMRDGKKHERRIHKLVGEHFIANPNGLPIVNHKDSDRSNHSVDNLEWVDNSGNQLHRWKTQKEGLKKMKYEKEYGLNKVAELVSSPQSPLLRNGGVSNAQKETKGLSTVAKTGIGAALGATLPAAAKLIMSRGKSAGNIIEHGFTGAIGGLLGSQV